MSLFLLKYLRKENRGEWKDPNEVHVPPRPQQEDHL